LREVSFDFFSFKLDFVFSFYFETFFIFLVLIIFNFDIAREICISESVITSFRLRIRFSSFLRTFLYNNIGINRRTYKTKIHDHRTISIFLGLLRIETIATYILDTTLLKFAHLGSRWINYQSWCYIWVTLMFLGTFTFSIQLCFGSFAHFPCFHSFFHIFFLLLLLFSLALFNFKCAEFINIAFRKTIEK
jgi:hypothetical protein